MILTNGTYDIVNHSRIPRRAGAPPGSIAVGAPVMAVSLPLMLPIEVQRVGEDTYQFRLQTNHTVILGHSEQARKEVMPEVIEVQRDLAFVKLMRSSQDALWEVSGSEDGRFRIRVPNTDRCWTIPRFGGGLPPVSA
ncbi:unnamed protein product [Rhizoctonia solani]|uniref:Uncharacterized protein n=1 Tax=Rhizoctonia solani TaxID=456999 RepID=A0A8H3BL16_9AGAM|nr:unnamed protein product [Rhizoctonia solani]